MSKFINVGGDIVDIEGKSFIWVQSELWVYSADQALGSSNNHAIFKGAQARRAYEWLCSACVATFDEDEQADTRYDDDFMAIETDDGVWLCLHRETGKWVSFEKDGIKLRVSVVKSGHFGSKESALEAGARYIGQQNGVGDNPPVTDTAPTDDALARAEETGVYAFGEWVIMAQDFSNIPRKWRAFNRNWCAFLSDKDGYDMTLLNNPKIAIVFKTIQDAIDAIEYYINS